jgi:hypothetical protein
MNDEGLARLENNLFTTKAFAEENPNNTVAPVITRNMWST